VHLTGICTHAGVLIGIVSFKCFLLEEISLFISRSNGCVLARSVKAACSAVTNEIATSTLDGAINWFRSIYRSHIYFNISIIIYPIFYDFCDSSLIYITVFLSSD
jgi:hypothetical protein